MANLTVSHTVSLVSWSPPEQTSVDTDLMLMKGTDGIDNIVYGLFLLIGLKRIQVNRFKPDADHLASGLTH